MRSRVTRPTSWSCSATASRSSAAAQAALLLGIPVAHIAGGEITEGAFDDAIRHAVTKLRSLHFPAAEPTGARRPARVKTRRPS